MKTLRSRPVTLNPPPLSMAGRAYTKEELRNPHQPIVLDCEAFLAMFSSAYNQAEHIAIVGPTGTGKTGLGLTLCKIIGARKAKDGRPSRVTVLQTKPRDDTLRAILPEKEWPVIKTWPPNYAQEHVVVWPKGGPPSKRARNQRAVLLPLLDMVYTEGGQTLYVPEAAYFERPLAAPGKSGGGMGMSGTMAQIWSEGRSNKLGVIGDTQRPREVTRLMWSEPQWLMVYMPEDEEDLKRIAELSGFKREVYMIVPKLGEHEFLCIRRQRHEGQRELYVSRIDWDVVSTNRGNSDNHDRRTR